MKDQKVKVIKIQKPFISTREGWSRITSNVLYEDECRPLWFEVPSEYGKYLCPERSDGFLIGLLYTAMTEHCDVVCEAPVGERLLYQIREYLVPSVVKASHNLYAPKILASIDPQEIKSAGAVGTGISCGVDSLHVVANEWKSEYESLNITHLTLYKVGAFLNTGHQFEWQMDHARSFCEEYGFKLIETDSNLLDVFPRWHLLANTYSNVFAVYMLQKLWGTYYYASVGQDFSDFSLKNNDLFDSGHYDLLSLGCFSTPALRIYSEGGAKTRFEKTKQLVDFEPAQKYLHVCLHNSGGNCNVCQKCRRTLVTLDALNALDKFKSVFDVEYYRKHINDYYAWMLEQKWVVGGDNMIGDAYRILKSQIPFRLYVKDWIRQMPTRVKRKAKRIKWLRMLYRRYIRRVENWRDIPDVEFVTQMQGVV